MTKFEKVHEVADFVGGSVREDYSGRFMFGKSCWGIVTNDPDGAIRKATRLGLRGGRMDNMGLDYIVYWPHIRVKAKKGA